MKVVDIDSTYEVNDTHDLECILLRRCDGGFNSFWLSHDAEDYPTLSLLVKNDLATLNYVPEEFDAGFFSVGGKMVLGPPGMTTFSISKSRADDVAVLNSAVISFCSALQAAKDFFISNALPQSVRWQRL